MKELLKSYPESKVDVFISYVNQLKEDKDKEGRQVNWWAVKVNDKTYTDAFKKVFETGLFIDGDTVTLNWLKKLVVTYDYHAYKNKITISYPETIFDFQNVYQGDEFTFKKESGRVVYSHNILDPFNTKKEIIGAYGIIKNKRGEFIELLNMTDIQKMKNSSRMAYIWDAWFDRMVLKSVIKRICSVHFKDITGDIDIIDNELNEPEKAMISIELQDQISKANSRDELIPIYKNNLSTCNDVEAFLKLIEKRKCEILGEPTR